MRCFYYEDRRGFTIVEILAVMAVLAILAAIVLRVQDGVSERARRSQAEAELVLLSQVLESYKSQWGDYPWVTSGRAGEDVLWNALSGLSLPDGATVQLANRRSWLQELVGLQFADSTGNLLDELPNEAQLSGADVVIVDPWNQPYQYHYRSSELATDPWEKTGFVLLSLGPSGGVAFENGLTENSGVLPTGELPADYEVNDETYDNILAP
jgi:prepilin-type N-terminal cleavage/methylation domain-containing protein